MMEDEEKNMFQFNHFNFNVNNLEESIRFYQSAFDFTISRTFENKEKGFQLVYLTDQKTNFLLELTYFENYNEPYNLGDGEFHLALEVEDFSAAYKKHQDMGIICYENKEMGIYFVEDPTGYWIEILPK